MIYLYYFLLVPLLYSLNTLVVLSYANEHDHNLCLFLYTPPLRVIFPYLFEFGLGVLSYPFYKYLPSVASYPHNVVLGSIYCMC